MAVPGQYIVDQLMLLLSQDVGTLAAAAAMKVTLIKAPFTPGPLLSVAGLTAAAFAGATPKSPTTGAQQKFNDATTGGKVVQLQEPAGGWHWQATSITGLPETIYGYYVSDSTNAIVYMSATFTTPIVIAAVGDSVDIPYIRITLPPNVLY